jgi:hypothetical protein
MATATPVAAQGVTLDTFAERAPVLLARLSEHSELPLVAAPELANEVVMVRTKDRPLGEVLAALAEVLSAEWRRDRNTFVLSRPARTLRAWEEEVMRERRRQLDEAVATFQKNAGLESGWTWREAEAALRQARTLRDAGQVRSSTEGRIALLQAEQRLVGGRTIARILGQIDRDVLLARLVDGRRAVFASHPTRLQSGIGQGAGILAAFEAEHAALLEASGTLTEDTKPGGAIFSESDYKPQPLPAKPAKMMLLGEGMTWELVVADAEGNPLFRTETQIGFLLRAARRIADPLDLGNGPIQLRDDSREFLTAIYPGLMGRRPWEEDLPARARELLLDPESYDPLSLHTSDALAAVALQTGDDLIAWLPDVLAHPSVSPDRWTTKMFVDGAANSLSFERRDGWLRVVPVDPFAAVSNRTDRKFLGELAREAGSVGVWNLGLQAKVALHGGPSGASLLYRYRQALSLEFNGTEHSVAPEALQLFGLFPEQQRRRMREGLQIPVSTMAEAHRSLLSSWLYNAHRRFSLTATGPGQGSMMLDAWSSEPTNSFPNGIPSTAVLRIRTSELEHAYVRHEREYPRLDTYSARFLASRTAMAQSGVTGATVPTMFRMGRETLYRFEVDLGNGILLTSVLPDLEIDLKKPAVPFEQLPEEYRAEYAKALESQSRVNAIPVQRRTEPPPPAPRFRSD